MCNKCHLTPPSPPPAAQVRRRGGRLGTVLKEELFEDDLAVFHFVKANFFYFRSTLTFEGGIQGHGNGEVAATYDGVGKGTSVALLDHRSKLLASFLNGCFPFRGFQGCMIRFYAHNGVGIEFITCFWNLSLAAKFHKAIGDLLGCHSFKWLS